MHDHPSTLELQYQAKSALRQRMLQLRMAIPLKSIHDLSRKIVNNLLSLKEIQESKSVALFFPISKKNEVDLRELHLALLESNKQMAYPFIHRESKKMIFRFEPNFENFVHGCLGFSEPPEEAKEATELDIIIVPSLCLDPKGYRIGYGAGYYDRTLPKFCPPAKTIGVSFDFQFLSEVPFTTNDFILDGIVTDERVIYTKN